MSDITISDCRITLEHRQRRLAADTAVQAALREAATR
jgi:hypothetical protein